MRFLIVFTAFIAMAGPSLADDWPHWRGPNRNGITREFSGWEAGEWPLEELWRANVGEGATAPLAVAGQVYTMGWRDGKDHVLCLDADTGKTLWSANYSCPRYGRFATGDQGVFSGATSTPEYDKETGYLFTLSVDGDLICWNTKQHGRKVWGMNFHDKFHVPQRPRVGRSGLRDYGYTGSPLLYRDWLVVEVGAEEGALMAFDKRSGALRWVSESKSPGGHTGGPALMTVEGVPCVAIHNFDGLLVVRLDMGREGETVATYDWVTSYANNIARISITMSWIALAFTLLSPNAARAQPALGPLVVHRGRRRQSVGVERAGEPGRNLLSSRRGKQCPVRFVPPVSQIDRVDVDLPRRVVENGVKNIFGRRKPYMRVAARLTLPLVDCVEPESHERQGACVFLAAQIDDVRIVAQHIQTFADIRSVQFAA
jgi:outer membrane protein assembly factor BamB